MSRQNRTSIRSPRLSDFPQITGIYKYFVLHTTISFDTTPPPENTMIRKWQELQKLNYPYLVATHNNTITAFAYLAPYRTRNAYKHTAELSVYVDNNHQRQNIGSKLVAELLNKAPESDIREIIAVIASHDNTTTPSLAFHHKLGFKTVGTLRNVGHKHGVSIHTTILQKSLAPKTPETP